MTESGSALDIGTIADLRDSVGGDSAFLAELIDEFLQDAPNQLDSLRTAAASGDAAVARRAAHTLKGTSLTFGARELAALCQEAEAAAGAGDFDSVRSRLDGIDGEWGRVLRELLVLREGRA